MATRWGTALLTLALALGAAPSVHADAKSDIAAKQKEAMENYDLMDYAAARKLLNQALAQAKKAKLDKGPLAAKLYLRLGIAAFAENDEDGATVAFISAVQIDPKIQIEAAYRSPELTKLLDQARSEATGGDLGGEPGGVDCAAVKGLEHTILDTATQGAAQPIEALVGADVKSTRVSVMYRSEGATEFTEVKLTKEGACKYTGAIPAAAMTGDLMHYYVAAFGTGAKPVASRGSSGSPNIMELAAPRAGTVAMVPGDTEDPIGTGTTSTATTARVDVAGGVIRGGKPPKVYIAIAGGTGFGYVTGRTEGGSTVENCCIGNSLVVLTPELGFYINPKLSIGVAGRIGLPVGANVEGHATVAPSGLLRLRYALGASGEGVRVMGQIGGGVMRNTIKLENPDASMDTDVVAQGPLLVGAGVGYMKRMGATVAFIFDFSVLAGIAVVDKLGTSNLNSGVGADASIGLAFGF